MPILHGERAAVSEQNVSSQRVRGGMRDLEMCALYSGGETLAEIGQRYGVSRERVRQIVARNGVGRPGNRSVDPLKVLGLIPEASSIKDLARRLGARASAVEMVLKALAPMAIVEMEAYRHEATRNRLIDRMRALALELGRTPTKSDWDRHLPAASVLQKAFGSLTKAQLATGLALNRNGHPHMTAAQRAEIALRYVAGTRHAPGNAKDLAAEYGVTPNYISMVARSVAAV